MILPRWFFSFNNEMISIPFYGRIDKWCVLCMIAKLWKQTRMERVREKGKLFKNFNASVNIKQLWDGSKSFSPLFYFRGSNKKRKGILRRRRKKLFKVLMRVLLKIFAKGVKLLFFSLPSIHAIHPNVLFACEMIQFIFIFVVSCYPMIHHVKKC